MSTHIENIENIGTANFYNNSEKPPLPNSIPTPKGFIGREVELTEMQTAKDSGRTSFVLHGAGGVGKTDLALEFIRRNKSAYQAGFRIDMQGLSEKFLQPKDAKLEIIRAFEPTVSADLNDADVNKIYDSLLNQIKTILLFDNAKDREQIESLNNSAAFVVVTSRTKFRISGGFSKEIEQMSPSDARNLLYSITDNHRFDEQADNLAYLAGYLPMALLPLAALLADDVTLEIQNLIQKYSDRKEALRLKDPNRENLSVEASFDLSYETLNDKLKECWRKLAIFPADFDLEAMQSVWEIEDGTEIRRELIQKHLLEFNQKTKRSRLHDLARAYTNEKLSGIETIQSFYLFSGFYGKFVVSLKNKITLLSLYKFDSERINIESSFNWIADKVAYDDSLAALCGMYVGSSSQILLIRLHVRDFIRWMEVGLIAAQKINSNELKGSCLGNIGISYRQLGEYRKAIEYQKQSLQMAKEMNNRDMERLRLGNLGNSYFSLGEYEQGINCQKQALIIAKEINDRQSEGIHLNNLGILYNTLNNFEKAIECFNQSLKISIEVEHKQLESSNLGNLGSTYGSLKKNEKAIEFFQQALLKAREINDRYNEGNCLGNLGLAYIDLGKKEKARDCLIKAIAILEVMELPEAEIFRQNLAKLESEM